MAAMPGRGRPRGQKRKRNWNTEYPSFPGESSLNFRRVGPRTVGTTSSLSEAWLRCGEGFLDTSGTPALAEKTTTLGKHLELPPVLLKEATTSKSTSNITRILSENESQRDTGHRSHIDRFHSRNILCSEDGTNEDKMHLIDWETDSDKEEAINCNDPEDIESAVEISDCVSCASSPSLTCEDRLSEFPKSSTEILEYSSDSEKEDNSENILFLDSESSHRYHVDLGSAESQVMEQLKNPRGNSTETTLCTLQKQTKCSRTQEYSAKKKFLRYKVCII
ncbi:DNA repair-scaffolding protein-like [Suncus etruscus]|uniref:DNA repair-scaffolding protein-like n=1 Tax=Suncus etruscus TaxID=109475 RepID=UPI0021106294|nr:DNA repair-scaffolding protein-like [Suncus etruscus]